MVVTDAEFERWRGSIDTRLSEIERRLDEAHLVPGERLEQVMTEATESRKRVAERLEELEKAQVITAALNRRTGAQVRWLIAGLTVVIALAGILTKIL